MLRNLIESLDKNRQNFNTLLMQGTKACGGHLALRCPRERQTALNGKSFYYDQMDWSSFRKQNNGVDDTPSSTCFGVAAKALILLLPLGPMHQFRENWNPLGSQVASSVSVKQPMRD